MLKDLKRLEEVNLFNASFSANLTEDHRSPLKMFIQVSKMLIDNVKTIVDYKFCILANEGFSEYDGKILGILEEIVQDSAFCEKMMTHFQKADSQAGSVVADVTKEWESIIVAIHDSFTKFDEFTESIINYFNIERSERAITRLNVKGRYQKAFFKIKK